MSIRLIETLNIDIIIKNIENNLTAQTNSSEKRKRDDSGHGESQELPSNDEGKTDNSNESPRIIGEKEFVENAVVACTTCCRDGERKTEEGLDFVSWLL